MDDATFRKLYKRALYEARRYWHPDEAEDIAQEVLASFIKNPNSRQTIRQAVIDYVRANGAQIRSGGSRVCLLAAQQVVNEDALFNHRSEQRSIPQEFSAIEPFLEQLESVERCACTLYYVWGFTYDEIGHALGVSESRVAQRFAVILRKVKYWLSDKESVEVIENPEAKVTWIRDSETRICRCGCGKSFRVLKSSRDYYALSWHNPHYKPAPPKAGRPRRSVGTYHAGLEYDEEEDNSATESERPRKRDTGIYSRVQQSLSKMEATKSSSEGTRKSGVQSVEKEEVSSGSTVLKPQNEGMAKEESRQTEGYFEACFDAWLT